MYSCRLNCCVDVVDGNDREDGMESRDDMGEKDMEGMDRSCDVMMAGNCIMNYVYVGMDMSSRSTVYIPATGCW